jgi:hypothetical protein
VCKDGTACRKGGRCAESHVSGVVRGCVSVCLYVCACVCTAYLVGNYGGH